MGRAFPQDLRRGATSSYWSVAPCMWTVNVQSGRNDISEGLEPLKFNLFKIGIHFNITILHETLMLGTTHIVITA